MNRPACHHPWSRRPLLSRGYFRSRLGFEQLECRALLSVAPGGVARQVSPGWFESVGPAVEHKISPTNAFDAGGEEWIVQLSAASLAGISSASQAAGLFAGSGLSLVHGLGLPGQVLVRGSGAAAEWLRNNPKIAHFEPNSIVGIDATPNDERFSQLWGMNNTGQTGGSSGADINALAAWDISTGSAEIVVGVIDTGVDYTHPDLAANMWTNLGEIANNGVDDDANGFVDDVHGYDFVNNDGDPMDLHSHGTHVSGTIAAVGNNGIGVAGVNWSASIMALQFLDAGGSGDTADAVRAVNYATMMRDSYGVNVRLTSNSWGGGGFTQALFDAIEASGQSGLLFIAAAGNDGLNNDLSPHYPSNYNLDNVIAVAATDHNDTRASFSNYGITAVDLAAPGVNVYSTVPGGGYDSFSGTSMATPHVAGVAALAWSVSPSSTADQIRAALFAGADPIEDLGDIIATGARLNARGTLDQLGLAVASSDPAVGEVVTVRPTDFIIDFTNSYNPATVQATDLRVNKTPANSVVVLDSNSVRFHFNVSPVTSDGPQTMEIDAGSILRAGDARPIPAWFNTFFYDSLRMAVVSTTPADGAVLSAAPAQIVFDFNEPFDPSSVDRSDLSISLGSVLAATVIDSNTVAYTIEYASTVRELAVTYTLKNGALRDLFGTPSAVYTSGYLIDDPLINRYEAEDVPIPIDDLSTITSTITIDTPQTVADLDIELTILHTFDEDLRVTLIAPDGTSVVLFNDVGGIGDFNDNFIGTILDDEAATDLADGSSPFTGRFRPQGRLRDFDGLNAAGTWTLEIADTVEQDFGSLVSWAMVIDSGVSSSSNIIDDEDPGWDITGDWIEDTLVGFGYLGDSYIGLEGEATWTFNIAEPGEYRIAATWWGDAALSPAAPFSIHDGAALVDTVPVDQTRFPNDFTDSGATWENLGTFSITGSTLTVSLTVGGGSFVMADAIRIERVGDLPVVFRFESPDVPLALPDQATISSTLIVSSPLVIEDIDVELDITHTYDSDLDVYLIAPDGTRVELFTDVGGNGDGFTATILDDEADNAIAAASAPFTGRFRPKGTLAAFDGLNPMGTWRLEITDDAGQDVGTLNSWAIVITSDAEVAPPEIIDNSDPGFGLSGQWALGSGNSVGRNNDIHMAFGEPHLPTDVATWTFNLDSPGRYRVSATWFTNILFPSLFASAARFEVWDVDLGAPRGTAVVNQRSFPGDFSDAGSMWEDLGEFDILGDTLQVRLLSTTDNQTYVVADAVRIEKVGALSSAPEIHVTQGGYHIDDGAGSADFAVASFHHAVERTFTITNTGNQPLQLNGPVAVTGSVFTVVSQPAVNTVLPGESTTFVIEMSATTPGSHSAAVTFGNSDADEGFFQFAVTGSVLSTSIIDDGDPGFEMGPTPGNIGGWGESGGPGREFDFKFNRDNPGSDEYAIWTFNVTPGQYRVSTTWAFGFAGYDDTSLFTIFDGSFGAPATEVAGGRHINQQLDPNDTDYPTGFMFPLGTASSQNWERIDVVNITSNWLSVMLRATDPVQFVLADSVMIDRLGDVPAGPEIVVVEDQQSPVNGHAVSYGQTQLSQFVDKTFNVRNTGGSVLTITSPITIGGANSQAFTLQSGPNSTSIAPGGTSTFVVRLNATYEGIKNATIQFTTNDADESLISVPIAGEVLPYVISDDLDAGYSSVGMTHNDDIGIAYRNDFSLANTPAVQGAASATWTFDNLSPGSYYVALTWFDAGGDDLWADNTQLIVRDGGAEVSNVRFSQRNGPSGQQSFPFDGAQWQIMAFFNLTSPSATITITNDNASGLIMADGVLLNRTGGTIPPGNTEFIVGDSAGEQDLRQDDTEAIDAAMLNTLYWDEDPDDVADALASDLR